jgi:hypothetical protein
MLPAKKRAKDCVCAVPGLATDNDSTGWVFRNIAFIETRND